MKRLLTGGVGANAVWLATTCSSGAGRYLAEFLLPRAFGGAVGVGGTAGPVGGGGATGFTATGVLLANTGLGVEEVGPLAFAATFGLGVAVATVLVGAAALPGSLAAGVAAGVAVDFWAGLVAGVPAGFGEALTGGLAAALDAGFAAWFLAAGLLAAGLLAATGATLAGAWATVFWGALDDAGFGAVFAAGLTTGLAAGFEPDLTAALAAGFFRGWAELGAFTAVLFTGFSSPGRLLKALVAAPGRGAWAGLTGMLWGTPLGLQSARIVATQRRPAMSAPVRSLRP